MAHGHVVRTWEHGGHPAHRGHGGTILRKHSAGAVQEVAPHRPLRSSDEIASTAIVRSKAIVGIHSVYEDSDEDSGNATSNAMSEGSPAKKRLKSCGAGVGQGAKAMPWPLSWAWLLSRTQQHPDFRSPSPGPGWCSTEDGCQRCDIISLATSCIYVGDASYGYDPHHLARLAAVNQHGEVLMDILIRPRAPVLDFRTHQSGLSKGTFEAPNASLDFDVARGKLLALLSPQSLIVGYKISEDLRALRLFHRPLIDVALLFPVESRKRSQCHRLQDLAEHILHDVDEATGCARKLAHDTLERAITIMRLARHESSQPAPTCAFPPKEGSGCEVAVRHIPQDWGDAAAAKLMALCPGGVLHEQNGVHWLLSEVDPSDLRGEAALSFPNAISCDRAFDSLQALTDIHVQWLDAPGAPPLGAFLTEQALVKAFSFCGAVACARIPRKPMTREPQPFAFVSFLLREDAHRAAMQDQIQVQITPTWEISLKPRLARYGNSKDKRVAIRVGEATGLAFDWIHVTKR